MSKPWEIYKCDEPPNKTEKFSLSSAVELTEVYHVVHFEPSYSILRDKKIKAGLIFDKSVLNTERILVSWASPNCWAHGSRYGNIAFTFDFNDLIEDKNYYWVEVIKYGIHAPRILVTSKDYTGHKHLIPYDPTKDDGPWIIRHEKHWWKNSITLEFMFEEDLAMRRATDLWFVDHHQHMCKIDPKSCPDLGISARKARRRFFATLIGQDDIPFQLKHFTANDEDGVRQAKDNLRSGFGDLIASAYKQEFSGHLTEDSPAAEAIAKAALMYRGKDSMEDYVDTIALFASPENFEGVLTNLVLDLFELPDDSSFIDD